MSFWGRTILGNLTSTFTPPSDCSTVQFSQAWMKSGAFNYMQAHAGKYCTATTTVSDSSVISPWPTVKDAASCWPTATVEPPADIYSGWGFYSPGFACPAGFVTACGTVYGQSSSQLSGVDAFEFQFSVTASETAIGCCPPGYSCEWNSDAGLWQTCRLEATSTTVVAATCESVGTEDGSTQLVIPYTSDGTTATKVTLWAPLIQINWRENDVSLLNPSTAPSATTATETASPAASVSAPTATSTSTTAGSEDGNTQGLSASATIAVAVAVPIVCVSLIIAAVMFYLLRRRHPAKDLTEVTPKSPTPLVEADSDTYIAEVYGGQRALYELGAGKKANAHEIEARAVPVELPADSESKRA